jgi:signal transduction histidine kinase
MEEDQIALIRRIASVVGHELRKPMAVINNSAYFIKTKLGQDGKLDPKVEKHLGIVGSEIARADRLIGDILTYSRVMEAKPQKMAVNLIVEAALAAVTLPQTVKIKKEFSKDKPEALVDEKLFQDAVRRLLENAVDAMPQGGALTVSTAAAKKEVVVSVKDSGTGMKTEFMPLLFQPFSTTKPRGLGLGLAMVHKIMTAHKGRAEGKSSSGGAVFSLYLPQ